MTETIFTCQIHEKHGFECTNPAMLGDPDGLCILHSRDREKNPEAFREALLARWKQTQTYYQDFRGVFFPGQFNPGEVFGTGDFRKLDFSGATFNEGADFSGAIFRERADFTGAIFLEGADFTGATFTGELYFTGTEIDGQVVFRAINPRDKTGRALPFIGDFQNLEFQDRAVLRFHDLSLAQVRFTGTDLRHIDFRNVIWHSYSNWFFRKDVTWLPIRQAVYDELLLDEKEPSLFARVKSTLINLAVFWKWPYRHILKPDKGDYARVEELYRYLRINFEIKGDYKNAGDFHYGEMEMHRRASPWRRWVPISWYNLYRCLSGYGERPLWALIWLIVFIFGFSGLVWQLGLTVNSYGNWADFWDSFIYILQKSTLQRPDWPKPYTFGARFWTSLSVFLIPGQTALFLLSLRNRLGRRR